MAKYESDAFLDKYLPSNSSNSDQLKHTIFTCNNDITLIQSILILGPTGVGKSRLAKLITAHRCWVYFEKFHNFSEKGETIKPDKWDSLKKKWLDSGFTSILMDFGKPLDSLTISNIEGDIFESELFGHELGAFTSANKRKPGRLEKVPLLDILIDEIGNARITTQQRLLHLLQDRTFTRIGGNETIPLSARLLFATNRPLEKMVRDGTLQMDFYFRLLNGGIITLQPLRQRLSEIEDVLNSILKNLLAQLLQVDQRQTIKASPEDIAFAKSYPWPGNIRELEAALRSWLVARRWRSEATLQEIVLANSRHYKDLTPAEGLPNLSALLAPILEDRIARALAGSPISSPAKEVTAIKAAAEHALATQLTSMGFTKSVESLSRIMHEPSERALLSIREWISRVKKDNIAENGN